MSKRQHVFGKELHLQGTKLILEEIRSIQMKGIHRNARSKVGGVNKRICTKDFRKIAVLFWVYENLIWQYVNSGRHLKGNLTFFVNDVTSLFE